MHVITGTQHNKGSFHGPYLLHRLIPLILLLPARCILRSNTGLLRSLRDRKFLRAALLVYRARSACSKGLFQGIASAAMGFAGELVQEVLRGREGDMEDTAQRIDLVQREYLVRDGMGQGGADDSL